MSHRGGENKCRCLACGAELANVAREGFHPMGGLAFSTGGHYGSEFDPMDGSRVEVVVCDPCFVKADKHYCNINAPTPKEPE